MHEARSVWSSKANDPTLWKIRLCPGSPTSGWGIQAKKTPGPKAWLVRRVLHGERTLASRAASLSKQGLGGPADLTGGKIRKGNNRVEMVDAMEGNSCSSSLLHREALETAQKFLPSGTCRTARRSPRREQGVGRASSVKALQGRQRVTAMSKDRDMSN